MFQILITTLIAYVVTFLAMPVIILIADKKKLYDVPDRRKLHTQPIASLGGIGVFLGFIFGNLVGVDYSGQGQFQYLFAAAFLIFFIGLKDDIIALSATKKFLAQTIAAALIVQMAGIRITSFYGIGGFETLEPSLSVPLTYITIILIINAYNLIDGIDGLAGSLGLLSSLLFGTYFYFAGLPAYAAFAFALSGSLMAFLIFNYHPAKIFMGDSGSLLVGLVLAVLSLKFISVATSPESVLPLGSAVALGISVLILPLADTIRVFTIRMLRGRSPFSPDRNHVHHLLIDRGFSHSTATFICVTVNIVLIAAAYLLRGIGNTWIIAGLFFICFMSMGLLHLTHPGRRIIVTPRYSGEAPGLRSVSSKVINIDSKEELRSGNAQ
jgi:UDP-N-acetylmuramyl pentapeptide phosphotransferase/UDP-N-acetylglucosamine-1-phosphate transferase